MTEDSDMSCSEVARRLYDYLDRELDQPVIDAIRAHLRVCEECAQGTEFEQQMLLGLKRHLRQVAAPPALVGRVRAILRAEQPPPSNS
jgi:anti-sigma factor (TIGR02949 family)